ncbi:hypothetical protein ACH5RR_008861 [Cinchona calisaya]|uniref:Uncharacterized protein n=1 Tax=Cinchona calisaya TaxID=153742 RepID=A0ABD3ACY4_9GENT
MEPNIIEQEQGIAAHRKIMLLSNEDQVDAAVQMLQSLETFTKDAVLNNNPSIELLLNALGQEVMIVAPNLDCLRHVKFKSLHDFMEHLRKLEFTREHHPKVSLDVSKRMQSKKQFPVTKMMVKSLLVKSPASSAPSYLND